MLAICLVIETGLVFSYKTLRHTQLNMCVAMVNPNSDNVFMYVLSFKENANRVISGVVFSIWLYSFSTLRSLLLFVPDFMHLICSQVSCIHEHFALIPSFLIHAHISFFQRAICQRTSPLNPQLRVAQKSSLSPKKTKASH